MQNDFCHGGALAVKDGEKLVEPINSAQEKFDTIILTQDWHPEEQSSIATNNSAKVYSNIEMDYGCLLYTSPSPRDQRGSRLPACA